MELERLLRTVVARVKAFQGGEVDGWQRHEEDGRDADVGRAQPKQQQDHHAHDGGGLHDDERHAKKRASRGEAVREGGERKGEDVGAEHAPKDAGGREADLLPKRRGGQEPRKGTGDLQRSWKEQGLRERHARGLP